MVSVNDIRSIGISVKGLLKTTIIHPSQEVTTISHRPIQKRDLRAQTVIRGYDNPASAEAVSYLVLVDHLGGAEMECASVDIDD